MRIDTECGLTGWGEAKAQVGGMAQNQALTTLKSDAMGYVAALVRGRASRPDTREEWLWIAYVVLSVISIIGFIAFNVWLIAHAT